MTNFLFNIFLNPFLWLLIHILVYSYAIIVFIRNRDLWFQKVNNSKKTAVWTSLAFISIFVCLLLLIDSFINICKILQHTPVKDYRPREFDGGFVMFLFAFIIAYLGPFIFYISIEELFNDLEIFKNEALVEAVVTEIKIYEAEEGEDVTLFLRYQFEDVDYTGARIKFSNVDNKKWKVGDIEQIYCDSINPSAFIWAKEKKKSISYSFAIIFGALWTIGVMILVNYALKIK